MGASHPRYTLLAACSLLLAVDAVNWSKLPNPSDEKNGGFACGWRSEFDRLCDPDHILSTVESAAMVQEVLVDTERSVKAPCGGKGELKGYQLAVMLADHSKSFFYGATEDNARKTAQMVHNAWGVGDAACNNGVLLFLAKLDRQVFISTGAGAKPVLTDDHLDAIIHRMRPKLRAGDYDGAVLGAVKDIRSVLSAGKGGKSDVSSSMSALKREALYDGVMELVSGLAYVILPVALFVGVGWIDRRRYQSQQRGWQAVRARLLEIERAQAQAAAAAASTPAPSAPLASSPSTSAASGLPGSLSAGTATADGDTPYDGIDSPNESNDSSEACGLLGGSGAGDGLRRHQRRRRGGNSAADGSSSSSASSRPSNRGDGADSDDAGSDDDDVSGGGGGGVSSSIRHGSGVAAPGSSGWVDTRPLAARMPCCPICLDDFEPQPGASSAGASSLPSAGAGHAVSASSASSSSSSSAADAEQGHQAGTGAGTGGRRTITLPCQHRFHLDCADSWMGQHGRNTCPVCRATVYEAGNDDGGTGAGAAAAGGVPFAAGAAPATGPGAFGRGYGGGGGDGYGRSRHPLGRQYDDTLDMLFLMNALQRRYPTVVTDGLVRTWRDNPGRMRAGDPAFTALDPAVLRAAEAARTNNFGGYRSSGGFGGGSSFGGGGRGGGW